MKLDAEKVIEESSEEESSDTDEDMENESDVESEGDGDNEELPQKFDLTKLNERLENGPPSCSESEEDEEESDLEEDEFEGDSDNENEKSEDKEELIKAALKIYVTEEMDLRFPKKILISAITRAFGVDPIQIGHFDENTIRDIIRATFGGNLS